MRRARVWRAFGMAVLLVFSLVPFADAMAAGVEELLPAGAQAPLFEGVDIDGKPFSLEVELARGPVFLVFWSIF
ncbi:hypothetical protein N9903_00895 [bacterium]|nr:hypothetical protein [bacterium]